jgi:O-antigen ligase
MFVLLDTTYQYFEPNRLDIFGYKALLDNANRLTGPFGDNEGIPGAYLTKICFVNLIFLNFYLTYFFLEKKKNYLIFFLIILNVSYLCVILITGERISFLMSILSFLLFFILINKSKFFFLISGFVTFILFVIIINNNHYLKSRYEILLKFVIAKDYVSIDTAKISEKDLEKRNPINFLNNQWGAHYLTAIEIFKEKPLIGSGIKGFRMQCGKKEFEDIRSLSFYKRCSTHPHNIYFELLSETGFLGFSSIIIFFLILIYKNFRDILILKKIKFQKNDQILFACYVSSFAIFLAILWPIRSSGSFFSNLNGTMIWFNIYWIILFQSYFKRNNMI